MKHPDTAQPGAGDLAARLGLAIDPFSAGALPEFFFVGARRRFAVQQVVHALYFSGHIVLLTGDSGAGKTRALDEICRELENLAELCRVEATVLMDAAALRQALAAALGLPPVEDNGQLLAALAQLHPGEAEPLPAVLIVDDAHLLAVPTLAECEELVQGAGGRLRLLLVGEPGLETAWDQLGAAGAERIELAPLQQREVADYLRTRLQAAGYRDELPLTTAQLQELARHSRGHIAAIHQLAPALLAAPSSGGRTAFKGLPPLHIAALAAILAVLLLAFLYRGGSGEDAPPAGADGRVALPLPVGGDDRTALPLPAAAPASEPAPQAAPAAGATPVALPVAGAPVERGPAPAPEPAGPLPAAHHADAPPPPIAETRPAPAPATAQPPKAQPKPAAASVKPAPAPAKPKPAPASAKTASAKAGAATADERYLLKLPSQQFMVQLMAGYSRDKVAGFINSAGRGLKVHYFETRLQGKPWYVAVTGPYADRAAASAAINRLAPALREQKPWPRSVASIQADLGARAQ